MKEIEDSVKLKLSKITNTDAKDWFLVYKARFGMETVYRAIYEIYGRSTVATQAMTCVVAVNPIIAAGLTPKYIDVSRKTLSIDYKKIKEAKVIVAQNTFGIMNNVAELKKASDRLGAIIVEDSAHCIGRMCWDKLDNPIADISIHSFGIDKIIPDAKFGGAVCINPKMKDQKLATAIKKRLNDLPTLGQKKSLVARLYTPTLKVVNRLPKKEFLKSGLTRIGFYEPPVANAELSGDMDGLAAKPSPWMLKNMLKGMETLESNYSHRLKITKEYLKILGDTFEIPDAAKETPQPLLRLPILLPKNLNAEEIGANMRKDGYFVGKWYRPVLFPGVEDEKIYGLEIGETTRDVVARIANLPTNVSLEKAQEIATELIKRTATTKSPTFKPVPAKEWEKFEREKWGKDFLQSAGYYRLIKNTGASEIFGVYRDQKLVGGGVVCAKNGVCYVPFGPVYFDDDTQEFFIKELVKYGREKHYISVEIFPYLKLSRRNARGEIIEKFDQEKAFNLFKKLGFTWEGPTVELEWRVNRWLVIKDLSDVKTEKELVAGFKKNTRAKLRKVSQNLEVRELGRGELDIRVQLAKESNDKNGMSSRNLKYFQDIYDYFPEVKFIIAQIKNDGAVVAGRVLVYNKNEVISFISGTAQQHKNYQGMTFLQDWLLKDCLKRGINRVNFYGVRGKFSHNPLLEFKAQFGVEVEEFIGGFRLVLRPGIRAMRNAKTVTKKVIKRLIGKR
jgi:lipid II:glycine glycyltransferase (peptidoglycan interpeptide bridge formation enzyme)/dTDP-4-amino-4,6-dideoxygalactose transaminase